ncbi:TIGR03089 family protein [Marinitenerispora sediminis]|uniref:TIGR03089 family protein n=1 Tax=Marinitenerispora sediminis TaxID=1931232 RepID=A0A368TBE9_9ACTN|nr:TIGR03089 family protein [Marinitenerispora sediminis]RCV47912.1 TIGR03089 family protein [Marinitenerispora sediminis]RCV60494.1 TIGR03089 family protein [Marinitenerispora sediminis]RCV61045.1 TIGR03089 family protein [Marinitenerispora sediminis]
MPARTPGEMWRSAVAVDGGRPFVTAYDDGGGRVELSYATFDNWVAKTANLIVDGLGAEPGERVVLALPVHWQSLVWVLACWSAGVAVVPAADAPGGPAELPDGDIVVADAARLAAALDSGAREVVGASLHPLGAPLADCPPAALDYAVEVRGYGDRFDPPGAVGAGTLALDGAVRLTGAEVAVRAEERAAGWQLTPADRVAMITSASDLPAAFDPDLSGFLALVAPASSLVLTPGVDSANLQARLGMERVTAIAGAQPEPPSLLGSIRPLT